MVLELGNAKECSDYCTIALISHASKAMLKILQARLQQYMNRELPDVQAEFRKGRGTRDQINCQHPLDHRKIKSSRKTSISALLTMPKPLTVWIPTNWKILRGGNSKPPYLSPEKPACRSRRNNLDMKITDWFKTRKGIQ